MKKLLLAFFYLVSITSFAQDQVYQNFINPPAAAKPRVWWHWMNGNITKEGIQKDMEWMEKSGIGGLMNFDANLLTPVVVKKKLVYMSPEWKEAFKFTTELAKQKKLELAIAGSPGWSVTGGPWVEPKDGMKKYVWSITTITGGTTYSGKLNQPPSSTGKFQNAKQNTGGFGTSTKKIPEFYADAAVIAFKQPAHEKTIQELNPTVTSSGGSFNLSDLTDGSIAKSAQIPFKSYEEDLWIQYTFNEPVTFKAFTVSGAQHLPQEDFYGGPKNRFLQVSNDGINFKTIAQVSGSVVPHNTVAFEPTTAKFWRLAIKPFKQEVDPMLAMFGLGAGGPQNADIAEFNLYNTDRIDQFEDKAGFDPWREVASMSNKPTDAISTNDIIDLASKMDANGNLNWDAPVGKWTIIRLGYSLTGRENHPASPEATGLEVDKLDKEAVTRYINTYLDMYKDATGGSMGTEGLTHMMLDSYEAGHMTWSKSFPVEFKKRRGYSIFTWIPVLTGRVVQSRLDSEKFLWDFRKTIGELITENHYEVIGDELHKRGMKRYTESHENMRIYLADGMDVKRKSDIPMSAMWQPGALAEGPDEEIRSRADIRESASVAHLYGQNIVAGESMTTVRNSFSPHPGTLKRTADVEMASGLNRFVVHTSVHQPLDSLFPGFSLGPFGQWFTRQETWANQAKAWTNYLARSCYLLQQGKFVADVLYYYGENTNITSQFDKSLPAIPFGYEYDFANANVLVEIVKPVNKKLTTATGMRYSMLVLDTSARMMTLRVLNKLVEFAKAGVAISGQQPLQSPSLSDDASQYATTLKTLLAQPSVKFGADYKTQLKNLGVAEDLIIKKQEAEILYVHRTTADKEIYWLNNRSENNNLATISFRVKGKTPKLFHPMTGEVSAVSYSIVNGRTEINLSFTPWDAFFVVFEGTTTQLNVQLPTWKSTSTVSINGPWHVHFQKERGAPEKAVSFDNLNSFSTSSDNSIKYFSGTATYMNSFEVNALNKNEKIMLDLGDVKNLAEVIINGKNVGTLWKKPFQTDISKFLKIGKNTIEINVVNSWVNRLVGDMQPGAIKIGFTTMPLFKADSPLEPSGLLGPVQLIKLQQKNK
jgi:hypothetical protein